MVCPTCRWERNPFHVTYAVTTICPQRYCVDRRIVFSSSRARVKAFVHFSCTARLQLCAAFWFPKYLYSIIWEFLFQLILRIFWVDLIHYRNIDLYWIISLYRRRNALQCRHNLVSIGLKILIGPFFVEYFWSKVSNQPRLFHQKPK